MSRARIVSGLVLALAATLVLVTAGASPSTAQRRLRAQIYLTQAAVPRGLSERALVGFARGHSARRLVETTAEPIAQRKWIGNMVVSFGAPIGDLEFHILFYDITDGARNFVDDMSTFLNNRTQRTYLQRLQLARPRFRPNRRFELVVTVRREEVGRLTFETQGEEARRDGQVTFTDSETRARDSE